MSKTSKQMSIWMKIFTTFIMNTRINIVIQKEPLADTKSQIKNPIYKLANDMNKSQKMTIHRKNQGALTYEKIFNSSFKNRNANLSYVEMSFLIHQIRTNLKA